MRLIRLFPLPVLATLVLALFAGDASAFGKRGRKSAACDSGGCSAAAGWSFTVSGYSTCVGGKCEPVTAEVPAATDPASAQPAAGDDALDEVNALRAARGLRPFLRDDALTAGARACAAARAARLQFGHTANDFAFLPPGAAASAAGCAAYPAGYGWMSCCVYESATYGGAAWVTGADGRRYMQLFVR